MGHLLDRCSILDILEEAVVTRRAVAVELRSNQRFVDEVRDVVTENGEETAIFGTHEPIPVTDIHYVGRAEPVEPTYDGKIS
jgi:hypothetical protein